jgi:CheY-like chemotaxis protein
MKPRSILVVDDDEDVRTMLCTVLAAEGYSASGATDGVDALDRLHGSELPAMLVVDLMMPRMGGEELLREMMRETALAAIPVVIMSGHPTAKGTPLPAKVSAWLVKPVELDELLSVVQRVVQA